MSGPNGVTCHRCQGALRVWEQDRRYYVGCAYKSCALTALPREADDAINLAWHGSIPVPPSAPAMRRCEQPEVKK